LGAPRSIEDVARDDPSAIITTPIPFEEGLSKELALSAGPPMPRSFRIAT
jgi:hypothetical protein